MVERAYRTPACVRFLLSSRVHTYSCEGRQRPALRGPPRRPTFYPGCCPKPGRSVCNRQGGWHLHVHRSKVSQVLGGLVPGSWARWEVTVCVWSGEGLPWGSPFQGVREGRSSSSVASDKPEPCARWAPHRGCWFAKVPHSVSPGFLVCFSTSPGIHPHCPPCSAWHPVHRVGSPIPTCPARAQGATPGMSLISDPGLKE